ncbi:hypothetical protein BGZ94_000084 [Podila epigama]|nr:hypothetical protein BGZ94_000084 [Podila epigama]
MSKSCWGTAGLPDDGAQVYVKLIRSYLTAAAESKLEESLARRSEGPRRVDGAIGAGQTEHAIIKEYLTQEQADSTPIVKSSKSVEQTLSVSDASPRFGVPVAGRYEEDIRQLEHRSFEYVLRKEHVPASLTSQLEMLNSNLLLIKRKLAKEQTKPAPSPKPNIVQKLPRSQSPPN